MASRVRIERTGDRAYTVHGPDRFRVHVAGTAKDAIKRAEQLAKAQEKLGFQDVERMWLIEGIADKRKGKKRIPAYERAVALQRQLHAERFMEKAAGSKGVIPKSPKAPKAPKTFNPFASKLVRAQQERFTNKEAEAAFATIGGIKKGDVVKTYVDAFEADENRPFYGFGGSELVRVDQVRKFKDSHRSFVAVVGKAQRGRNVYTKTSLVIPLEFIYNIQQAGVRRSKKHDDVGFYVLDRARGGGAKLLDRAALDKTDAAFRKKNKPWWKFWG